MTTRSTTTSPNDASPQHQKRYKGDAHAVVAMIFRPIVINNNNNNSPSTTTSMAWTSQSVEEGHEEPKNQPLPVQIVPPSRCDTDNPSPEDLHDEPDIQYTPQYWQSLRNLLEACEVFFILRSTNERDRWSGQVGLPGGRKKKGESDLQCAARETFEEVGLELPYLASAGPVQQNFRFIGRLNDRVVAQNNRRLVVSTMMYVQHQHSITPPLKLEPTEVAACGWVPLKHFTLPQSASGMKLNVTASFVGRKYGFLAKVAEVVGVKSFVFVRVLLPLTEMHCSVALNSDSERELVLKQFSLWGLTLGMVSELLMSTNLRDGPFQLNSRVKVLGVLETEVDRVFDSKAHNIALYAWKSMLESISGQPLTWEQKVTSYMMFVIAGGVPAVLTASGVAMNKLFFQQPKSNL